MTVGEPVAALRAEVEQLRVDAGRQARLADRRAYRWSVVDLVVGFPAALLAAVSGVTGLVAQDARVPAALFALVAAGFSAASGFLRSDKRRVANKRARRAWAAVQDEALLVMARMGRLDEEALRRELRALFVARGIALSAYEDDGGSSSGSWPDHQAPCVHSGDSRPGPVTPRS